jgi:hypothetical protein
VLNVATDEGPRALCWLCRHAVTVHRVPVSCACDYERYESKDGTMRGIRWSEDRICLHTRAGIIPADARSKLDEYAAAKREMSRATFAALQNLSATEMDALVRHVDARQQEQRDAQAPAELAA